MVHICFESLFKGDFQLIQVALSLVSYLSTLSTLHFGELNDSDIIATKIYTNSNNLLIISGNNGIL